MESFYNSDLVNKLKILFDQINDCYLNLEEIKDFYDEELMEYVYAVELDDIVDFIEKWNEIMDNSEQMSVSDDINGICEIINWIEQKAEENDYSDLNNRLPDCIAYGDSITIFGAEKEKYELVMDDLNLNCENGGDDWLGITIYCDGEQCASGTIEITYGFVDFDEDCCIGDSCSEDISYQTCEIVNCIQNIVDDLEGHVKKQMDIVEMLRESFNIL